MPVSFYGSHTICRKHLLTADVFVLSYNMPQTSKHLQNEGLQFMLKLKAFTKSTSVQHFLQAKHLICDRKSELLYHPSDLFKDSLLREKEEKRAQRPAGIKPTTYLLRLICSPTLPQLLPVNQRLMTPILCFS